MKRDRDDGRVTTYGGPPYLGSRFHQSGNRGEHPDRVRQAAHALLAETGERRRDEMARQRAFWRAEVSKALEEAAEAGCNIGHFYDRRLDMTLDLTVTNVDTYGSISVTYRKGVRNRAKRWESVRDLRKYLGLDD